MAFLHHAACNLFRRAACLQTIADRGHDRGMPELLAMQSPATFRSVLRRNGMLAVEYRQFGVTIEVPPVLAVDTARRTA